MLIDSHAHVLDPGLWPSSVETIGHENTSDQMAGLLDRVGCSGVVLVEAHGGVGESKRLLRLAQEVGWITGVVASAAHALDPPTPPWQRYADESHSSYLRGFRGPPDLLARFGRCDKRISNLIAHLEERGYPLDVLIRDPRDLTHALHTARQFPALKVVIEHAASPPVGLDEDAKCAWFADVVELASCRNVFVKLSVGRDLAKKWDTWAVQTVEGFIRHLILHFAEDRVMVGSNWPIVSNLAPYEMVMATLREWCEWGKDAERLRWKTTAECYRLMPVDG